jgi:ribosomal protein S18 acetylase RimI-like enzyme
MSCTPEDTEGAWVVESVAVLPEFRRQGVVTALLSEVLDGGRKNGYTLAQIGVLIDNIPARSAYERQGFIFESQKTTPEFEAVFGSLGIAKLILEL